MDLLAAYLETPATDIEAGENQTHLQAKCDALLSPDLTRRDARTRLMIAYHLIRQNPGVAAPQVVAAELLEIAGAREHMSTTWQALHNRFPESPEILRNLLGWLARDDRRQEAGTLIEGYFEGAEMSLETLVSKAEFYNELQDFTQSDALFHDLIKRDTFNPLPRVIFAKSLFSRGNIQGAFEILEPVRRKITSPEGKRIIKATDRAIIAMETISPCSSQGELSAPLALRNALSLFATRQTKQLKPDSVTKVAFGAGLLGASPQSDRGLLKLAMEMSAQELTIGAEKLRADTEVICESLSEAPNWQGYQSACGDAGLTILPFERLTPYPLTALPPEAELVKDIFTLLPRTTKRGVEALLQHFRNTTPQLLVLHSEEAILPFVLAGLLAEVPRIVINLRSEAPTQDASENSPQYKDIYHALLAIPGLHLTAATPDLADGYARWLELPAGAIRVLREPVFERAERLSREETLMWQSFELATDQSNRTLALHIGQGSVAQSWFERMSAALLHNPQLRVLAICATSVRQALKALARDAGLGPRLLLVEERGEIDTWLARADLFSTFGTDAVARGHIAQAQLLGLPVLLPTTATNRDLIADGSTGHLLPRGAEDQAFQAALQNLLDPAANHQPMRLAAKERARQRHGAQAVMTKLWQLALEDGQQRPSQGAIPAAGTSAMNRATQRSPLHDGAVTEAYSVVAREPTNTRSSA